MNAKKKSSGGAQAILWWVAWIVLTIASFFVASAFWTPLIARKFGSVRDGGAAVWWVVAVFGSWMLLLLPLIIVMYSKVDKAYEDARFRRETARAASSQPKTRFRSVRIDPGARLLPPGLHSAMKKVPGAIANGQLVTATLRDGRKIPYVFVAGKKEVLGVYGKTALDFRVGDIVGVESSDLDSLPVFREEEWLRLDGAGIEEA